VIGRVPVYPEAQRTFLPIYVAVQPEVPIGPLPPRKTHLPQRFSLSVYAIARSPFPLSPSLHATPWARRQGPACDGGSSIRDFGLYSRIYVKRERRVFGDSGVVSEKQTAHSELEECLLTVSMSAPACSQKVRLLQISQP
jgi:hypothetical protein